MVAKNHKKRSSKRAISPVISSVIMTGAMVAIVSVALLFANNTLWSQVAESEFTASKQLMHTIGLQIDDVAWTIGRTGTIRYASQYGEVVFDPSAITYEVSVNGEALEPYETGALMFNLPTSRYTITNNYFENISPDQMEYLILNGTSAPVTRVFVVEKVPMADGSYIRVVVIPAVRVLYSDITTGGNTTHYIKMYLPVLSAGEAPRLSKSITLTGESRDAKLITGVNSINVTVSAQEGSVYDFAFSQFPFDPSQDVFAPEDAVLEIYLGEVSVGFGLNY